MGWSSKKNISNRSEKGAVIAEAALVLPLLLAVLFFIIEFGIVLYLSNSLNQIARTAARYASVTTSYTNQDLVNYTMASSILPNVNNLSLTSSPSSRMVGDAITITVNYTYTPILNPFGLLYSSNSWSPTVRSVSVARAEVAGP